jgi:hypothetical protein
MELEPAPAGTLPERGWSVAIRLRASDMDVPTRLGPKRRRSVQPGVELATYSIEGQPLEPGNLT